jgi:endonuclease YncB( thermonuclease family)
MTGISQENELIGQKDRHPGRLSSPSGFRKMTRRPGIGKNTVDCASRSCGMVVICSLLLASLTGLQPALAETIDIGRKVVVRAGSVIDGDSIMVNKDNQDIVVRLFGIDSPEYDQPGSKAARRHSAALVKGKSLVLEVMDHDAYGRTVALVSAGSLSINEEQVRAGQAWVHPRYCRIGICDRWRELQQQACSRKIGLWQQQHPMAPWRWKAKKAARR